MALRYHPAVETTRTFSRGDDTEKRERSHEARLVVALECDRPLANPRAYTIGKGAGLIVGRGPERKLDGDGDSLRLEVPDPWMSGQHVRIWREDRGWHAEDLGSKNGT